MQPSDDVPIVEEHHGDDGTAEAQVYHSMAVGADNFKVHPCATMFAATDTPGRYFIRYEHKLDDKDVCVRCGEAVVHNALMRTETLAVYLRRRTDA